ncbi:ras association domain-containing protein 10 [Betta splendens]|uniref:Ras association domain-containing protein 10 n=1 Tax=Betta splendens TaxID=158456 RepID=A0A6P7M3R0_BETSP|nr:ras association domain-containing protein 10 [Betta splendens]
MESEESQISVWVCREEKLVLGLSKRTTCADVVQVLLEDQRSKHGLSTATSYCIVEKWRGFERALPKKTKILRLWGAWGEEQKNVKFVLVRSEAALASDAARSAEARVVPSKHGPCVDQGSPRGPTEGVSPEKQRRIVRKAFRKLEKMKKKEAHRDAARSAERMETLVHVVVSRDHTIRQQIERIAELDAEIERCEAKVHCDRMRRHGANYVQDTYSVDAAVASGRDGDGERPSDTLAEFEEHARRCEEVLTLQEELWEREALIDIITAQMREELSRRRTLDARQRERERPVPDAGADSARERELLVEGDRMKTQLDASLYVGLRLSTDLKAIRADLERTQEIYEAREKEMRDLLEKVNALDAEGGTGTDGNSGVMSTLEGKSEWVERARGLSTALSADDDSDTGLSSLHSQDSDSLLVWESLV